MARVYAGLERLAFGDLLLQARTCLLAETKTPSRVLIVGEGDGRTLQRVLEQFPNARIDCLEQSPEMIRKARERVDSAKVRWLQQNIITFEPEPAGYDLIVTTFILDSFTGEVLAGLMRKLAMGLKLGGQWYYADFYVPEQGWGRARAQTWLTLMYTFFRVFTKLGVSGLEPPDKHFETLGLTLTDERFLSNELLVARLYTWSQRS